MHAIQHVVPHADVEVAVGNGLKNHWFLFRGLPRYDLGKTWSELKTTQVRVEPYFQVEHFAYMKSLSKLTYDSHI